jgi:F-box and WD-40 domain protein CDC4
MDASVRVWNLQTGECQHVLTGHTSLVGLLGLSPSYLVSAAADSTLRIWDPDTGELRHTLAAHTGAITCFQHDEFKVLSGSDGNLKMWNVRDGTVVRDLLTGITGVWQVVFEGRWVVAASNRNDTTVLDVWDFGLENDEDWVGEPPGGLYDEDIFSDDDDEDEEEGYSLLKAKRGAEEDEEQEQADVDAMDEDLVASSDTDSVVEVEYDESGEGRVRRSEDDNADVEIPDASEGVDASRWAPQATVSVSSLTAAGPSTSSSTSRPQRSLATSRRRQHSPPPAAGGSSSGGTMRTLPPTNDETPTAPRRRQPSHGHSTRRR